MCLAFATGLSTARDKIPPCRMAFIFGDSLLYAFANAFLCALESYEIGSITLTSIALGLYIIGYLGFILLCLRGFWKSRRILRRHLVMIHSQGIEPHGTPTWRKMRMLQRLRWIVILSFFAFVPSTILFLSEIAEYWILSLITIVVDMGILSTMCYLCRIRSKMAAVYGEDQSAYSVEDGSLREWKPGMTLPPMPSGASSEIHAAEPDFHCL
jgi:hypothetical protein